MSLLTPEFLRNIGINLSDSDAEALSEHFESTLQERVIDQTVEVLDTDQAQQMLTLKNDEQGFREWLIVNVPQFDQIVSEQVDLLLKEIYQNKDQL